MVGKRVNILNINQRNASVSSRGLRRRAALFSTWSSSSGLLIAQRSLSSQSEDIADAKNHFSGAKAGTATSPVTDLQSPEVSVAATCSAQDTLPQVEPTLADLDVSIPTVSMEFMGALVRRRMKMKQHLIRKAELGWRPTAEGGTMIPMRWTTTTESQEQTDNATDMPSAVAPETETQLIAAAQIEAETRLVQMSDDELDEIEVPPFRAEYEDNVTLIDLRTVDEVTSWGIIEGAKVVPMHQFWEAFQDGTDEQKFFDDFGFPKPRKTDTLILYCQHGARSTMAAQILHFLGYKDLSVLGDGGYYEWQMQFNKLVARIRLHDIESGNEERRLKEFYVARGISRDIAPEFNEVVQAEVRQLHIDETRTSGSKIKLERSPVIESLYQEEKAFVLEQSSTENKHEQHQLPESDSSVTMQQLLKVTGGADVKESSTAMLGVPTIAPEREREKFETQARWRDAKQVPVQNSDYPKFIEENSDEVSMFTKVLRAVGIKKRKKVMSTKTLRDEQMEADRQRLLAFRSQKKKYGGSNITR